MQLLVNCNLATFVTICLLIWLIIDISNNYQHTQILTLSLPFSLIHSYADKHTQIFCLISINKIFLQFFQHFCNFSKIQIQSNKLQIYMIFNYSEFSRKTIKNQSFSFSELIIMKTRTVFFLTLQQQQIIGKSFSFAIFSLKINRKDEKFFEKK